MWVEQVNSAWHGGVSGQEEAGTGQDTSRIDTVFFPGETGRLEGFLARELNYTTKVFKSSF